MGLSRRFASITPQKKKKRNYSGTCGTPGLVRELRRNNAREPVSVFTE
jgi:hypothetical protein